MASTMAFSFSMLFSSGLLLGLPLGIPPLESNPQLMQAAPDDVLWCMTSSGMATPDPDSENHTEQLLAEEELGAFINEVKTQIIAAAERSANRTEERILVREVPGLVEALLTRPLLIYIANVEPPADRGPPRFELGMVVDLGENAANVEESVAKLMRLAEEEGAPLERQSSDGVPWYVLVPEEGIELRLGMHEQYFLFTIGEGEASRLLERLKSDTRSLPGYLAAARERLGVERVSTLGYLNVARIVREFGPLLGPREDALATFGVDNITAIYSGTGLDEIACVTKVEIELDGPPTGILAMLPHEPLSKRDLRAIPEDAMAAAAVRIDVDRLIDQILDLVSEFDEHARDNFEGAMWQAEKEVGINPRDDLIRNLGDVFTIYMPSGDLMTAWLGATASVKVKDAETLRDAVGTLIDRAEQELAADDDIQLKMTEYRGHELRYVQIANVPVSPSWCITDDYAFVALSPQSLKSTLIRVTSDRPRKTLADAEGIAAAFSAPHAPSSMVYLDTESLFRGFYPMLQLFAQMASGQLQQEGFEFDMSMLPSSESIAMHLTPSYSTWTRTGDGFVFESHQAVPGGDLVSAAPVGAALLLPAIQAARHSARTAQDINNMRQILLAMLNYESAYGKFPADITDDEGNKLLSWRVAILPFIEQQALYEQFHLDEPWDSEHNLPLSRTVVPAFTSPTIQPSPFVTRYVAIAGEKTLMPPGGVKMRQIKDGTSRTVLLALASPEAAVNWSQPGDIEFDADNPARGMWAEQGRFTFGFGDGSVQRLGAHMPKDLLKNLLLRDDGNVIDYEDYR